LATVPIALVGIEAAHAIANAVFGSPAEDGELFASGSSGVALVPPLLAAVLGMVAVSLGGRVVGRWSAPRQARSVALPFAWLPPVAFVLLELVEGLLHAGTVPWGSTLEPTFFVGLALQVPFALAGYLIARALLRVSDGVCSLIGRGRSLPLPALRVSPCRPRDEHGSTVRRSWAHSGRAPPVSRVAPS
jgi:hypothetical protein